MNYNILKNFTQRKTRNVHELTLCRIHIHNPHNQEAFGWPLCLLRLRKHPVFFLCGTWIPGRAPLWGKFCRWEWASSIYFQSYMRRPSGIPQGWPRPLFLCVLCTLYGGYWSVQAKINFSSSFSRSVNHAAGWRRRRSCTLGLHYFSCTTFDRVWMNNEHPNHLMGSPHA